MHRVLLVLGIAVIALVEATSPDGSLEAATRQLLSTVQQQSDGNRLLLLSSLRQLRDPTLHGFFMQLAQCGGPMARSHAILGLAEIDPSRHVDPALIMQLDSPAVRYSTIQTAIQLDLIDTPQMHELLDWGDLEAKSRVLFYAEILSRGDPVDRKALTDLAAHPDLSVAGLAACLLARPGDHAALGALKTRLEAAPEAARNFLLPELCAAVTIYRLTSVVDWIAETAQRRDLPPGVIAECVSTLLALDPDRGVAVWAAALEADPSYSNAVRYGLLLLYAAPSVPASSFDRLPSNDKLLASMANAGRMLTTGDKVALALIELVDLGHRGTIGWVMGAARDLDDEQSTRLYKHLIDTLETGDPRWRGARAEVAFVAVSRLVAIDSEAVTARLDRASQNSVTQEVILLGLLESTSSAAGVAARRMNRTGFSRADAVATILVAKHNKQLTPEELRHLRVIATGGGRIGEILRAQAAWLYVRHAHFTE